MNRPRHTLGNFLDDSNKLALILILPAAILIFGVLIFPMITSLAMSFTGLNLTNPASKTFIGFSNYLTALREPLFWAAFRRTCYFALITVTIETILGLGIAQLLNQDFVGRRFVRGLVILPWALPYVVNGMMWKWIFDANYGALNALLKQVGFIDSYRIWLGNPHTALKFVIFANIWKETPVAVVLILAALQTFPKELYEAAKVDGANRWYSFKRITLPLLKPTIMVTVVLKIIWALKEFDLIHVMTKGGPADATNLFSYYIYQNTFRFLKFGYGSALAYLLTLTAGLVAIIYIITSKTIEEQI